MLKRIAPLVLILLFAFFPPALAHPGKLDENGGHYDYSTGEYHYHHGYPAHQHPNGVCPYDYDDQTRHNEKQSSQAYIAPAWYTVAPRPTATPFSTSTPSLSSAVIRVKSQNSNFRSFGIILSASGGAIVYYLFCAMGRKMFKQ